MKTLLIYAFFITNAFASNSLTTSFDKGAVRLSGSTMTGNLTVASDLLISHGTGSGIRNTFFGVTGSSGTTDSEDTAIGYGALALVTSGSDNTAIGYNSLTSVGIGSANMGVGTNAGRSITSGSSNVAIGLESYYSGNGDSNISIGRGSLYNGISSNNVAIGYNAGIQVTSGGSNIFLGYKAGYNKTGATTGQLWIANTDSGTGTNLITGDFANGKVGINVDPGSIDASAALEVDSTTRGFLPPQMTTTQKLAITAKEGLVVYDLTLHQLSYYNGTAWTNL